MTSLPIGSSTKNLYFPKKYRELVETIIKNSKEISLNIDSSSYGLIIWLCAYHGMRDIKQQEHIKTIEDLENYIRHHKTGDLNEN